MHINWLACILFAEFLKNLKISKIIENYFGFLMRIAAKESAVFLKTSAFGIVRIYFSKHLYSDFFHILLGDRILFSVFYAVGLKSQTSLFDEL